MDSPRDRGAENHEFLAIEMIDRKIRFSWNVGGGTQHITHNVTLETSFGTGLGIASQDHMWYRITAERIGNSGRLNVRKVRPIYDDPDYHRWVVDESPPGANVFELEANDLIYVGGVSGIPDYVRSSYLRTDSFAGILYDLSIDGENIGVWNFITSHGCRETHSGISEDQASLEHSSCFTFNGNGYAMQRDFRNYDPRYLSISMEFRSFDANAILLFAVNEQHDQYLALELKKGHLFLTLNYGMGKRMVFVTNHVYNNGEWVKVEAARALRNGVETGILRVVKGNEKEDLMDTISFPSQVSFQMERCLIYFGGVPPGFDVSSYRNLEGLQKGFLGNLRSITVSNPGSNSPLNPLYAQRIKPNLFFGVKPNCERKIVKGVSFDGDGFIELKSQPLRQTCNFGFSFNTMQNTCLLVLSAFKGSPNEPVKFYSVSIMGGKLVLKFSSTHDQSVGKVTSFVTEETYNDGSVHTVTILKQDNMIMVYVDDQLVTHSSGILIMPSISSHSSNGSPSNNVLGPLDGSLFVGGLPGIVKSNVEAAAMAASTDGLVGTIKDMAFMDDTSVRIISMNEPLSILNAAVGRFKTFRQEISPTSGSSLPTFSRSNAFQWHHSSYGQMQINEIVDLNFQEHRRSSQADVVH